MILLRLIQAFSSFSQICRRSQSLILFIITAQSHVDPYGWWWGMSALYPLYVRLYLALSTHGLTLHTQVSPSEWCMAGCLLPQLCGCMFAKAFCPAPSATAAPQPCPAPVAPGKLGLWEQKSALTFFSESVCLSSMLSREILFWHSVRAAGSVGFSLGAVAKVSWTDPVEVVRGRKMTWDNCCQGEWNVSLAC